MKFSVSTQSFYDDNYEKNAIVDDLPSDVKTINSEQYANFFIAINSGRVIYLVSDELKISQARPDKYHSWDEISKTWIVTDAALKQRMADSIADTERRKAASLSVASTAISPLQDAVDLGMATDVETSQLIEWKKYRVLLMRVDIKNPVWPAMPGEQA